MEGFAILLTGPVVAVISGGYCYLLNRFGRRYETARRLALIGSLVVLGTLALELVLLASLGAVRSRGLFGPAFTIGHESLFPLGVPALGAALVLRENPGTVGLWYVAASICAVFAVGLVIMQYGVTDALFGVDGVGGPYPGPW